MTVTPAMIIMLIVYSSDFWVELRLAIWAWWWSVLWRQVRITIWAIKSSATRASEIVVIAILTSTIVTMLSWIIRLFYRCGLSINLNFGRGRFLTRIYYVSFTILLLCWFLILWKTACQNLIFLSFFRVHTMWRNLDTWLCSILIHWWYVFAFIHAYFFLLEDWSLKRNYDCFLYL